MSLKVAELFATLGLDSREIDRTLDRSMRDARRSVAKGMTDAAKAGGDELRDGLEGSATDSIDAVVKVLRSSSSDVDRAGRTVGEAFADGMERGAQDVEPIDVEALGGRRSLFSREGSQLGEAFADGVSTGVRGVSGGVDPASLGGSRSEFSAEGERLGESLAEGIGDGMGDGGSGPANDAVGGFLDALPAAMTSPATAAGAAVAAAFVIGMEEAFASEATGKRLAASLNVDFDGTDYAAIGTTISNLLAGGWERGQAAEAVEAVFSSLEESQGSQQALEDLSNQALAFSQVFGTDLATGVELARTLISEGLAKDGTEAFDLLSQAMSDTPLYNRDELAEAVREYSQYFAGIGLDGPQAMAILADAADGGSYVIDKTGDSVKEFGIIMRDMPDAARTALEGMGLDVEDLRAKIAAGGPEAEEAFGQIMAAVRDIEDPLKRGQTGVALFGVPFEDVAGNVERMDQVLQSLASGGMTEFEGASARNVDAMDTMDAKVQGVMNDMRSVVGTAVGGMIYSIGGLYDDEIQAEFAAGWEQLNFLARIGVDGVLFDLVRIPQFVGGIPGMIADAASGMWNSITSGASSAASWVTGTFDGVVSFVTGLPGRIAEAAAGMWNGIKTSFRNALLAIAAGWNSLTFPTFQIPSVNVPGFGQIGGGSIGGWDLPNITIPEFHTGGILPGPSGKEGLFLGLGGEMVLTEDQQAAIGAALNADLSAAMLGPDAGLRAAAAGGSSVSMAEVSTLATQVGALAREVALKGDTYNVYSNDAARVPKHIGRHKRAGAWSRGVG